MLDCFVKLTKTNLKILIDIFGVKFCFNNLCETVWVIKIFYCRKLKYLFERFRCRTNTFWRTASDVLHFKCLKIRPCQIDFLFSVTRECEKTRRIEPFHSKSSVSILFYYYRWKKEHFSYISILTIFCLNKQ